MPPLHDNEKILNYDGNSFFWLYAADELLRSEGLLESFSFFNGPKMILVIKY